jgi:transketolase N-terminal domain/subunit
MLKSGGTLSNPELMRLLNACNAVAQRFDQPILYQSKGGEEGSADEAFHISIGWALDLPVDEESNKALEVFRDGEFESVETWKIPVPGVKVKIGNVVSHVPLSSGAVSTASRRQSRSLFGL